MARGDGPGASGDPAQRILNALAWWDRLGVEAPTRVQVAMVAGRSPSPGSFASLLKAMRDDGLLEYPADGRLALTEAGVERAVYPDELPDPASFREAVCAMLKGDHPKVFLALWKYGPLTREEIAEHLGKSAKPGSFATMLRKLLDMGLVVYPSPGVVALAPEVSPEVFDG